MTVYVSDIIGDDALGLLLIDTAEVRNYTLEARYAAFLLAQRSLASLQPKATATHAAQRLVAGAKQSIPTGGLQLIDVVWNSGTDGTTIGRAITLIDRGELALIDPDWAKAPADSAVEVIHYAFDDRDPTVFYVYPPQPATESYRQYVEIVYSEPPDDITLAGAGDHESHYDVAITVPETYQAALTHYVAAHLLSRDNHTVNGAQRSRMHMDTFFALIDRKDLIGKAYSPNMPYLQVQSG